MFLKKGEQNIDMVVTKKSLEKTLPRHTTNSDLDILKDPNIKLRISDNPEGEIAINKSFNH